MFAPPPMGTKTAWISPGCWRRISMPMVPCPAITSGSSKGGMNTAPLWPIRSWVCRQASLKDSPESTTCPPRRRTAEILMAGVVTGMTMVASQPRRWADRATPWAWFPAEAAMTPRRSSSGERRAILLYAPRSLKEKTGCKSSRLSSTLLPSRRDRLTASSRGVSTATS